MKVHRERELLTKILCLYCARSGPISYHQASHLSSSSSSRGKPCRRFISCNRYDRRFHVVSVPDHRLRLFYAVPRVVSGLVTASLLVLSHFLLLLLLFFFIIFISCILPFCYFGEFGEIDGNDESHPQLSLASSVYSIYRTCSSVEASLHHLKGSLAPLPRRLRISMFSHNGDGADSWSPATFLLNLVCRQLHSSPVT